LDPEVPVNDFFHWLTGNYYLHAAPFREIVTNDPAWMVLDRPRKYFGQFLEHMDKVPKSLPDRVLAMYGFLLVDALVAFCLLAWLRLPSTQSLWIMVVPVLPGLSIANLIVRDLPTRKAYNLLLNELCDRAERDLRLSLLRADQGEITIWNDVYAGMANQMAEHGQRSAADPTLRSDLRTCNESEHELRTFDHLLLTSLWDSPVCGHHEDKSKLDLDPQTPVSPKVLADAREVQEHWDAFSELRSKMREIAKRRKYIT
jgi:hypothetical protein